MLDILHIDMDSFYASVEMVEHPEFKNKPLVVSGDTTSRSVVSTANYVARKYGIFSAMPLKTALSKCKNLIVIKASFEKYERTSKIIYDIISQFTSEMEQASIDEFYIDVKSSHLLFGTSQEIAKKIKNEIYKKLKITCSIGISYNKLLAKMASNLNKPNGLTILSKENFHHLMDKLPIDKIPGIGPKTKKILNTHQVYSIKDLQNIDISELKRLVGMEALYLHQAASGMGNSEITKIVEPRSVSNEITLDYDTKDENILKHVLLELCDKVARRLRENNITGKTIKLKIKYFDFKSITKQIKLNKEIISSEDISKNIMDLLADREDKPIRLLGVGVSSLIDKNKTEQLVMFQSEQESKKVEYEHKIDAIADKFGNKAIKRASLL